jgi:hypothetical protein
MLKDTRSLSMEEGANLVETFSELEIKRALDEMKSNIAPSPDGLPSNFCKIF